MRIERTGAPLKVLFVGFQDQDNLGLRYLMSAAAAAGHAVGIETFAARPEALVDRVLREKPDVIGFSLIFQYMAEQFDAAVTALRQAGCRAHVVLGGHFPSFEPETVLKIVSGADSVIRFEGEATLLDLLSALGTGAEWRSLPGLAARLDDGKVQVNDLRPQIADLDDLPWPDRTDIPYEQSDQPTAAILGSRGCPWKCDFCSIRPFYAAQKGALRRLRSPADVVAEMRHLYHDRGVSLFLFQDDDFLATGTRARNWAGELADRIADSDIGGRVAWKMSCRSDELRPDIIARLKRGGLTHVYMGVESGDEQGLKNMNKMLGPERHIAAGRMLHDAGISFDFGFMLLDPWSDFAMVRSNILFLEEFVGDGWSVAGFCRMLPYAGTQTARKLAAEGRLAGTLLEPDYRFLDPRLDRFHDWMVKTFHQRNSTSGGLAHVLRSLIFESRLTCADSAWMRPAETRWLQYMAARSNLSAFRTLMQALDCLEAGPPDDVTAHSGCLADLTARELAEQGRLMRQVRRFWNNPDRQARRKARHDAWLSGGFDRSWTHAGASGAEPAWETRGIGVL